MKKLRMLLTEAAICKAILHNTSIMCSHWSNLPHFLQKITCLTHHTKKDSNPLQLKFLHATNTKSM